MEKSYITRAVEVIARKSVGRPLNADATITINFHPDAMIANMTLIEALARDGVYKSQFETGTSNGGLSAFKGGKRWQWESSIFQGVYDSAPVEFRPKYGALNFRDYTVGGSPRFGSSYLRLKSNLLERTTFAYPDSHLNPKNFGVADQMNLVELAEVNSQRLDILDNYIEAQVHGTINLDTDVDAIVLDPSFRGTKIEKVAKELHCAVEWHEGFSLPVSEIKRCSRYRGKDVGEFLMQVDVETHIKPSDLTPFRFNTIDKQLLKNAWHCLARFGVS